MKEEYKKVRLVDCKKKTVIKNQKEEINCKKK